MTTWRPIPNGTRVRHIHEGYEGWIDGTTTILNGSNVNPDGRSQYRIFVLGDEKRRRAADKDIQVSNNTSPILAQVIRLEGFEILAMGKYHARPDLATHPLSSASLNHTDMIRGLKWGNATAVDYFFRQLEGVVGRTLSITVVPSHDPNRPNEGLTALVGRLVQAGRVDATSSLLRHQEIIPSHYARDIGEDRENMNRHLDSIGVRNESLISSMVVLLLDDIVTSGASLMACRKLLLDRGAAKVICVALGKSTR